MTNTSRRRAGFSGLRFGMMIALACVAVARPLWADCVYTTRPANAQEKKIYADGFALLQRMAPPVPAGWAQSDSPKDNVLTEVCAPSAAALTEWSFSRMYNKGGEQERAAASANQAISLGQQQQARMKANESKLAEIKKQMDALMQRMQTLVAAQRFAEMEKLSVEMDTLVAQQMKLMGVDESNAAIQAIDAVATKDVDATFSITVGATNVDTAAYKPFTAPVGRGFRQEFVGDNGNPHADVMIVLPAAPGAGPGQTVVRISGDPARVEELLKTARLR